MLRIVFLVGWALGWVMRLASWREHRLKVSIDRSTSVDRILMLLDFLGSQILPVVYVLTPWLAFADYHLPAWAGVIGAVVFAGGLLLNWRSHADLGASYSTAMQIREEQALISHGAYCYIRHPMYAALWLWGIGQALLLQNWIAGLASLVFFGARYFYRIPREEQMMLEHSGQEYRLYMARTGRVIPRFSRS